MIYALVTAAIAVCTVVGGVYPVVAGYGYQSAVAVSALYTDVADHIPLIDAGLLYDRATGQQLFDAVTGLPIYA